MSEQPLTRERAIERHREMLTDKEWAKRYLMGDAGARAELAAVHRALSGEPAPATTPRQQAEARKAELMADPAWRQLYLGGDAVARAEMANLHAAIAAEEPGQ